MNEKPKFSIAFNEAKVVNLETMEETTFTRLADAEADGIAGKGLDTFNRALRLAGGTDIHEADDESDAPS